MPKTKAGKTRDDLLRAASAPLHPQQQYRITKRPGQEDCAYRIIRGLVRMLKSRFGEKLKYINVHEGAPGAGEPRQAGRSNR